MKQYVIHPSTCPYEIPSGDIHNEWEPVLVKALDDLLQRPEHLHPAFFADAAIHVDVERPPVLNHAAAHVSDPII